MNVLSTVASSPREKLLSYDQRNTQESTHTEALISEKSVSDIVTR